MDAESIEYYDKMRHRLGTGFTATWMAWYAFHIYTSYVQIEGEALRIVVNLLGTVAGLVWAVWMIRFWHFGKRLKDNPEIREALNDELAVQYRYKSAFAGLCATGIALATLIGITSFAPVSGKFVCEILLYILVSSTMIAFIVYAKNSSICRTCN
jgi:hypothetical protein